jgi:hypothetical protein
LPLRLARELVARAYGGLEGLAQHAHFARIARQRGVERRQGRGLDGQLQVTRIVRERIAR